MFGNIMQRWWKPYLSALVSPSGKALYGMNAQQVEDFGCDAAAVIFLGCTFIEEPEPWLANIHLRIFIEQDPALSHIWANESSPNKVFGQHNIYFTEGPNIGTNKCKVPTFGIDWLPIWNLVILDWWNLMYPVTRTRFTTVAG